MKKLNILIATEAFYPDGIGGAHTYVYNLSKQLVQKGHNVYVITLRLTEELLYEEKLDGVNVFRYDSAVTGRLLFIRRPFLSIINSRKVFNNLVKKTKFDIINYHLALPAFAINISSKSSSIPKIFTFHSSMCRDVSIQMRKKRYSAFFFNRPILFIIKLIEKMNFKGCNKIIVLSKFSKQFLVDNYHIKPQKIIVIRGGVDINKFSPPENRFLMRGNLSLPKDKTIILTARRLVARMGLENLIFAMEDVIKAENNFLLLIIGEGFLKNKLAKLIKKLNLEKYVNLIGSVDADKMALYYKAADFFVLPSEHDEWFGLVTLEALSSGLPVLGTPLGGTKEILERFNKDYLFKGISAKDIAKGIINFLRSKKDFAAISQKCRQFVLKNYSWEKVSNETETVYFKEINNKD